MTTMRCVRSLTVVVVALAVCWGASQAAAQSGLAVTNFKANEEIRYPAPLLEGTVSDAALTEVTVTNLASQRPTREIKGIAYKGQFKALTELVPGQNKLEITAGSQKLPFTLTYKAQTNAYIVRVVFFVNSQGDTTVDSPRPVGPEDYKGRLDTALKLMQSFTAEWMNRHGYGRKTFNLEFDKDGRVIVHLVKDTQPTTQSGGRNSLFGRVSGLVHKALPPCQTSSTMVFLGKGCGYTALGGGGVALFGADTQYTWPISLNEAQAAFMDATPIDNKKYHCDDAGRGTFWGNSSTCIGAALHELGHSFGLPHVADGRGIMSRGFDGFNRFWTLVEPACAKHAEPVEFTNSAWFSPVSAEALASSRFFTLDAKTYADLPKTAIEFDTTKGVLTVKNPAGIGFLGLEIPGRADYFVPINHSKPLPKEFTIPFAQIRDNVKLGAKDKNIQARVIDAQGDMATKKVPATDVGFAAATSAPTTAAASK